MKYLTHSEADTLRFAGRLAELLRPGDAVLLHGDLGAGKSVFARGVARALGVTGAMPSPTFTLLIPYEGTQKLYHFDLYRLKSVAEALDMGAEDYFYSGHYCFIEWPDVADALLPDNCAEASIEEADNGTRILTLR